MHQQGLVVHAPIRQARIAFTSNARLPNTPRMTVLAAQRHCQGSGCERDFADTQPQGRRAALAMLLAGSLVMMSGPAQAALQLPNKEVDNDTSPYIQELLRRTEEKKEERREQRLNDYYKRNFREYFEYEASDKRLAERRGIKPETQAAIAKWLEDNK